MHRRSILATLFAATGGLFAAAASSAQANPAYPDKQKVAYHPAGPTRSVSCWATSAITSRASAASRT